MTQKQRIALLALGAAIIGTALFVVILLGGAQPHKAARAPQTASKAPVASAPATPNTVTSDEAEPQPGPGLAGPLKVLSVKVELLPAVHDGVNDIVASPGERIARVTTSYVNVGTVAAFAETDKLTDIVGHSYEREVSGPDDNGKTTGLPTVAQPGLKGASFDYYRVPVAIQPETAEVIGTPSTDGEVTPYGPVTVKIAGS